MEDFLYILLLVAWVVFSIYNKNKKKKQPATSKTPIQHDEGYEPAPQRPKSILEQILLGEEPEPIPYEEQASDLQLNDNFEDEVVKQDNNKEISDAEIAAKYDFDPAKEGYSSDESYGEINDFPKGEDSEKEIDFDLRQAVIFSEILKRPYAN
ncbi:MAG: hypothetical protein K8S00_02895 [Bacteroidales bacterium]|nr:hypothetical protein [Bacteroidales bacterium]